MTCVHLARRPDGVAVLTIDTPDSAVNVLSTVFLAEFREALEAVEKDPEIRACVVASGKPDSFIAGGDLHEILRVTDPREAEAYSREGEGLLEKIAACRKPWVAAIHGAALGGGLESAMACHYRMATDHPKTVLALPEVMLGLLPAGGGTQRLPRLVGLSRALPMLLTGRRLRARNARRAGLVDALTSPGGLVDTAARAALRLADGTLRPARRNASLGDRVMTLPLVRSLVLWRARREVLARTRGFYPAPLCILDCVEEGLSRGFAAGVKKESKLFGKLAASSDAKNLIRLFDATNELKKLPDSPPPRPVRRLAVLGAGLMGEGIAAVSVALNPVVLKDVSEASLARSARHLHDELQKRVRSGRLPRVERDRQWYGVHLTADPGDVAGADLVIEAVFEDLALKRQVLAETEAVIGPEAVFASNTSALPIGDIAAGAAHPERVLGMHYFSPVPKMPLLEIVVAKGTAPGAVATARAYGVAQGKTVIVVKDGPGFYTTRILAPYLNEAVVLLEEGASVEALDRALLEFGFPVGPATLLDEVGLDVGAHVSRDLGAAFADRGLAASGSLTRLVEAGYRGRKNERGFYRYPKERRKGRKSVNGDVYAFFGGAERRPMPPRDIADRLTLLMVNEAVYCLSDGVISGTRDGDVGAVLGLGFPPFRGGPFRYVDALGVSAVVERLSKLASACGPRFAPAPLLVAMAKDERRFHAAA